MLRKFMMTLSSIMAKRELIDNINGDLEIISKQILPTTMKMAKHYQQVNFISLEADDFNKLVTKELKGLVRNGTFFDIEQYILEQIKGKLLICMDILNKQENEELMRDSISVESLNVVRIVEISRFALDFIRAANIVMLSGAENTAIYRADLEKKGNLIVTDYGDMTPDQVEWLDKNVHSFFEVARVLVKPNKEFIQEFNQMSDVSLSPDTVESIVAVNGPKRVDPFNLRNFSVGALPTLIFGEFAATYVTNRYLAAEAEAMLVENTLLNLESQRNGKENAKLEYQIQYYKARLDKLNAQNDKVRARYKIGS